MDITDKHQEISDQTNSSLLPTPCVVSFTNNGMDHIIPQMVVTPADDIPEADQDACQKSKSEELPSKVPSNVWVEKEVVKPVSAEIIEETFTVIAEDYTSETKNEDVNTLPDKEKTKSVESVSHSISQRPLIIDSDRSTSHSTLMEINTMVSNNVATPETITITTMQRPLIFNGSHVQADTPSLTQCNETVDAVKDTIEEVPLATESNLLPESETEASTTAQEPSSPIVLQKDNFSYRDLDERDDLIQETDINANLEHKEKIVSCLEKKDNLQNVKKNFGSLLPSDNVAELSNDKVKYSKENITSSDNSEKKQSKTDKPGIKKLFSHSKNEPSSKDKSVLTDNELNTKLNDSKDSKYNIKKMFDSLKFDSSSPNSKVAENLNTEKTWTENVDEEFKPHYKDSKSSIKKFFNSFKQTDSNVSSKEASIVDIEKDICIKVPVTIPQSETKIKTIETSLEKKDTTDIDSSRIQSTTHEGKESDASKQQEHPSSIKKFFDSFKQEKSNIIKSDPQTIDSDISILPHESTPSESKESDSSKRQEHPSSMKKFFDSFKHDKSETAKIGPGIKNSEVSILPQTSTLGESKESSINKQQEPPSSMKKFLESFKHEKSEITKIDHGEKDSDVSVPPHSSMLSESSTNKLERPSSKKNFFDSLKHEKSDIAKIDSVKKDSDVCVLPDSSMLSESSTNKQQEQPSSKKNFFDSFKHEKSNIAKSEPKINDSGVSVLPHVSTLSEGKESDSNKQQDHPSSMKKFFDSFKHEKSETVKNDLGKNDSEVKRNKVKKSHSFKENLLSSHSDRGETEKDSDSKKNVKKLFDTFHLDIHSSSKTAKEQKNNSLKRSQSCRETTAGSSEGSHGFKNFIDSLTHKKISSHSSKKDTAEHIYDVVEKTAIPSSSTPGVGVFPQSRDRLEELHGVRKLFDSFRHKDSDSKPKTSDGPKKVRMNDDVQYASETLNIASTSKTLFGRESSLKTVTIQKPKEATKSIIKSDKTLPAIQIDGPKTNVGDGKHSMLSSLSDNFSAFKEKMFQPKEEKKCKVAPEEECMKTGEYDVQNAAKIESSDEVVGTYKSLEDPYFDSKNKHSVTLPCKSSDVKKPSMIQMTSIPTTLQERQSLKSTVPNKTFKNQKTPESLYDTCCFKLAVLFSNKAIEMVSDKSRIPPKKPPKPSAEAIAQARAKVVSQRLKEMHHQGQSVGESIPVGYDGIRFADDETESSCDYKDVDNFDYIMDYELINRYKFENKLDTFSDPSTCSGSYYTADTVTLKDENFSDVAMETVSLGSDDSNNKFSLAPLGKSVSNIKLTSAAKVKTKLQPSSQALSGQKLPNNLTKVVLPNEIQTLKCKIQTTKKKIPPPLPPKPSATLKQKSMKNESTVAQPVSECINGLSLSPRSKAKLPKDTLATKNRPLVVSGLKETEFVGLQTKSKERRHSKDLKFDTVLKNESLNKISTISLAHEPLTSSKSSPGILDHSDSDKSSIKKNVPERPPPPVIHLEDKRAKHTRVPPQVPEKPKREHIFVGTLNEKRTVSPPRPPPPIVSKCSSPPPRPPPPSLVIQSPHNSSSSLFVSKQDKSTHSAEKESIPSYQNTLISSKILEEPQPSTSYQISSDTFISKEYENYPKPKSSDKIDSYISLNKKTAIDVLQSASEANISLENQPNLPVIVKEDISHEPDHSHIKSEVKDLPKPPPRNRRMRSRTVEIIKVEKTPEPTLRRSHSLSDLDIQQKISYLNMPEKTDLKHLYTSVNKNGKRSESNLSQSSSLEKLSGRPLPAPPPPPRKFRSLDHKPKEKRKTETALVERKGTPQEKAVSEPFDPSLQSVVHPPARKKKVEHHRFHSLGHNHSRKKLETPTENLNIIRSQSVPLRPGRRHKYPNVQYDENANVAIPIEAEVHRSDIILDECGNEIQNTNISNHDTTDAFFTKDPLVKETPNPRRKKEKNSKGKSYSSWYDQSQGSEDFEVVNWTPSDEAESRFVINTKSPPKRRRSDPGKGARRTSKFYIDQTELSLLPLVDKETSPVRLDCSEKSVQTSLETLSRGMISQDEGDDTDELLDLAQTLQNELKVIINRHKSTSDVANDSSSSHTPVLSRTDSEEKNLGVNSGTKLKEFPSVLSSNSELWPLSSSDESDNESLPKGPVSLTEIALKRKKKKIFYIAQEIMTSEEVFVDALKLLNVDFKAAVDSANQQKGMSVVPDEVLSQILNHLPQLQHLNENLSNELKDRIESWNKLEKIADIIVKMGPFLKLYSWYIHDFEYNVSLLEESKRKYPPFAQVVKDFEASARCKRLTLNHYMLKPIQRIPQYRLLLQEYLHHLPEDHPDYQDTVAALQIVSEVATHANDSMKHGDNAQKLISIQNSIMGHKEIIKPGRLFIKEGELMKLSRKGMQPRWFVLLNDLLLYLTPVQQGLYRVNHELPLTGMKVAIPIQQDYQNEFSIISVARSFTLAARSPEERQEWIIVLTKAIEENASKRSTFTNVRLQQKCIDKTLEDDEGEFILGKKAPVWIPDARVTMCQLCTSEFTVTFRRHHCRACGKVVCSICSSNRISLPYLGNRIARVCDDCHLKLGPGSGTCTESAETDSDNQQIAVKPHLRTENRHVKKGKRNLPSVLKEVCANDQGSTISGYLQKKSGKSWKRDWFVVKDKVLYEYRASEDVAASKSLPLLGYQIESFSEAYENVDPSLLFQLIHPGQTPIIFHADSVGSTERWITALREASVLE